MDMPYIDTESRAFFVGKSVLSQKRDASSRGGHRPPQNADWAAGSWGLVSAEHPRLGSFGGRRDLLECLRMHKLNSFQIGAAKRGHKCSFEQATAVL